MFDPPADVAGAREGTPGERDVARAKNASPQTWAASASPQGVGESCVRSAGMMRRSIQAGTADGTENRGPVRLGQLLAMR